MGWKDLLSAEESLILPWVGGRHLRKDERVWTIEGKLPQEHGWGLFLCKTNRKAGYKEYVEPHPDLLTHILYGYLVGNRLVPDNTRGDSNPLNIASQTEEVFIIDPGVDRFSRISAGRVFNTGPLIFRTQEFPLGPEAGVYSAFLDEKTDVDDIKEVSPALDAAFRMETWQREETKRRRLELERHRLEEEEKRQREERRKELVEKLGDAQGRRAIAQMDFGEAARAALAVGGATYLDHRRAVRGHEMVVRFRLLNRRFECTCDNKTLRIIDAGICLNAHYNDEDFEAGTKGDNWFTLESLPGVIMQAERERKLVIFRHVD
jgi:hypothetical protein